MLKPVNNFYKAPAHYNEWIKEAKQSAWSEESFSSECIPMRRYQTVYVLFEEKIVLVHVKLNGVTFLN